MGCMGLVHTNMAHTNPDAHPNYDMHLLDDTEQGTCKDAMPLLLAVSSC